ncbi:MAG: hypothetical protein Q7U66_11225 [Methylobacter sp.]|nr:hypothetical protein [Methylobacter sp.]
MQLGNPQQIKYPIPVGGKASHHPADLVDTLRLPYSLILLTEEIAGVQASPALQKPLMSGNSFSLSDTRLQLICLGILFSASYLTSPVGRNKATQA